MNEVSTQKFVSDVKVLIDDAEALLRATASETGERIGELRQRLEKKIEAGRKALAEEESAWREKAAEAKTSTESYLRENPWNGVAIAAGVGLVFGLLLRRN